VAIEPVRFEDGKAMQLVGIRRMQTYAGMRTSIPEQWAEFQQWLPLDGQRGDITYGVMCQQTSDGIEYMTGVEVGDFLDAPAELGRMRVPAQHYAVFVHGGGIATIGETWTGIMEDWLPRSAWADAHTPPFERYDARFDPVTGTGGIELWIPVAPKR
jgi:AraC family transcriptional regulator